jgi:hypothetical protein
VFSGKEAPGALTLVIWFTHIGMFLFDQDATLGKRRGQDKASYGDWGESAREDDVLRAAEMMERREKGGASSKSSRFFSLFSLLICTLFARCLSVGFYFLFSLGP